MDYDDFDDVKGFLEAGDEIFVPDKNENNEYLRGKYISEDLENGKVYVEMDYSFIVGYDLEETYRINLEETENYFKERF